MYKILQNMGWGTAPDHLSKPKYRKYKISSPKHAPQIDHPSQGKLV